MCAQANELRGAVGKGRRRMIQQMPIRTLCAIIRSNGINDAKPNSVTRERDWELVGQNMILRFEIRGLQGEDAGEGRRG